MASKSRRANPSIKDTLFEESYRFDFFQAVRLLEKLYPERQPVGKTASPSDEVVRFKSLTSLTFPPSSIYEISEKEDKAAEMTVAFMGLTGPSGILPRHYTELLIECSKDRDFAIHSFFDVFNHRLVSLFYRAWEKYRIDISYAKGRLDHFYHYLLSIIGLGTPGLQDRLEANDRMLLFYTGLISQKPHSVSALENLLQDIFNVQVKVRQFQGQWFKLEASNRTTLAKNGQNNELGVSVVLGERVWDQQAKFRIRIGPLGYNAFCEFLPSGNAFLPLTQIVRLFVGEEFDSDVQLILKTEEVPACKLGDSSKNASRLGWSTWLKTKDFSEDAGDVVIGIN